MYPSAPSTSEGQRTGAVLVGKHIDGWRWLRLHLPYRLWRQVRKYHGHRYSTSALGGEVWCSECGHRLRVAGQPALYAVNGQIHVGLSGPEWWDPTQTPVVHP